MSMAGSGRPRGEVFSLRRLSAFRLFCCEFPLFFCVAPLLALVCLSCPAELVHALPLSSLPRPASLSLLPPSPAACLSSLASWRTVSCRGNGEAPRGVRRHRHTGPADREAARERRERHEEHEESERAKRNKHGACCPSNDDARLAFLATRPFSDLRIPRQAFLSFSPLSFSSLSSFSSLFSSLSRSFSLSRSSARSTSPVIFSRRRVSSGVFQALETEPFPREAPKTLSRSLVSSLPSPLSSAGPVPPVAENPMEPFRHPLSSSATSRVGLNSTMVEQVLESVRPYLRSHGGNVKLVELDSENRIARLAFKGACSGCPSAQQTLYEGLQGALREVWPDIRVEEAQDDGVWEELSSLTIDSVNEALRGTRPAIERLGASLEVLSVSPSGDIVIRYQGPNAQTIRIGVEMELRDKLPPDLLGSIEIVTEDKPPPGSSPESEKPPSTAAQQNGKENVEDRRQNFHLAEAQNDSLRVEENGQNVGGLTDEDEYEGLEPEPA